MDYKVASVRSSSIYHKQVVNKRMRAPAVLSSKGDMMRPCVTVADANFGGLCKLLDLPEIELRIGACKLWKQNRDQVSQCYRLYSHTSQ